MQNHSTDDGDRQLSHSAADREGEVSDATKRKLKLGILFATVLVVVVGILIGRNLRYGRDLIFYSDDVAEFVLPNGKSVLTNTWYFQNDLMGEEQEFFSSPTGLGIVGPGKDGYVTIPGESDGSAFVRLVKSHTTTINIKLAMTRVGEKALRGGSYDEYWVSRSEAKGQQ